jgi:hypothetical protein
MLRGGGCDFAITVLCCVRGARSRNKLPSCSSTAAAQRRPSINPWIIRRSYIMSVLCDEHTARGSGTVQAFAYAAFPNSIFIHFFSLFCVVRSSITMISVISVVSRLRLFLYEIRLFRLLYYLITALGGVRLYYSFRGLSGVGSFPVEEKLGIWVLA